MNKEIQKHSKKMLTFLALSLGSVAGTSLHAGLDDLPIGERLEIFNKSLQYIQALSEGDRKKTSSGYFDRLVDAFKSLPEEMRLEIWRKSDPTSKRDIFKGLPKDRQWEFWQQSEPEVQRNTIRALPQISMEDSWKAWLLLDDEGREENFDFLCKLLDEVQMRYYRQLTPWGKRVHFSRLAKKNKLQACSLLDKDGQRSNFSNLPEDRQWALWEKFTPEEKDRHATTFFNRVIVERIQNLRKAWNEISPQAQRSLNVFAAKGIEEALGIN